MVVQLFESEQNPFCGIYHGDQTTAYSKLIAITLRLTVWSRPFGYTLKLIPLRVSPSSNLTCPFLDGAQIGFEGKNDLQTSALRARTEILETSRLGPAGGFRNLKVTNTETCIPRNCLANAFSLLIPRSLPFYSKLGARAMRLNLISPPSPACFSR